MERNYQADNCRALLIVLVVFGHLLEASSPLIHSELGFSLWTAVYSFHMPAFIFLNGMFAKTEIRSTTTSVIHIALWFLLMNALIAAATVYVGGTYTFALFQPAFSTWYLLALIGMRLLLPFLDKLKYPLPLLLGIALLTPMLTGIDGFQALARTACFLPFFMCGYLVGPAGFHDRSRENRLANIVIVVAAIALVIGCVLLVQNKITHRSVFSGAGSFAAHKLGPKRGLAIRCYVILTAFVCTRALFVVMPKGKNVLTRIGANSLAAYMLQAPIIILLRNLLRDSLGTLPPTWQTVGLLLVASVAFTAVATATPIVAIFQRPAQFVSARMLKPSEPSE